MARPRPSAGDIVGDTISPRAPAPPGGLSCSAPPSEEAQEESPRPPTAAASPAGDAAGDAAESVTESSVGSPRVPHASTNGAAASDGGDNDASPRAPQSGGSEERVSKGEWSSSTGDPDRLLPHGA